MKNRFEVLVIRFLQFLTASCWKVNQPVLGSLVAMLAINPKAIVSVRYDTRAPHALDPLMGDADKAELQSIDVYISLADATSVRLGLIANEQDFLLFAKEIAFLLDFTTLIDPTEQEWPFAGYFADHEGTFGVGMTFSAAGIEYHGTRVTFKSLEILEDVETWPAGIKAVLQNPLANELQQHAQEEQQQQRQMTEDEVFEELLKRIDANGYTMVAGGDHLNGEVPFVHTVGLASHALPEVIVIGLLSSHAANMLEDICNRLVEKGSVEWPEEGILFAPNNDSALRCCLKLWTDELLEQLPPKFAQRYAEHRGLPYSMAQLFWSDENGKFEWDEGFNPEMVGLQKFEVAPEPTVPA